MAENAVVGALRVFLGLDSAEFETGLKTANDNAKGWAKRLKSSLDVSLGGLEGEIRGMSAQAGILGDSLAAAGLAGAAAGAALVAAWSGAKSAMAFGDEIADSAERLQVTTDYLQEMRWAAREFGAEFEDADKALDGFTKAWGLATSGLSPKAVKPFTALGLDPKDFDTVEQAMTAVMGKISALGNTAQQAAIADKLGLGSILTGLRAGPGAFQDMMRSAHDWGSVMDAQLINKAADAQGEYDRLTRQLEVQFKSAMVEATPLVMTLTSWLVNGAKAAGEFAGMLSDAGKAIDELSTHDLSGNSVGPNQRDRLFQRMAVQQGTRRLAARADAVPQSQGATVANIRATLNIKEPKSQEALELEKAAAAAAAKAAADRKAAEATRAAEAAERARISALQAGNRELMAADERITSYIAALQEEVATQGLTSDQIKRRSIELMAQAAPTEALADQIRLLGKQYLDQNKVGAEAAEVQAQVRQQMDATITTFAEATAGGVRFSSELEILAFELGDVADISDDVRYGVDSIARSIQDNDWTSAFANLATVLAKVETAFRAGASSAEKFAAVSSLVGGVGNMIGGSTGSAISGAASGAMTGFTMGGPIGAVAGGILGGLGSLFGSSKAKKQAKKQAEAQKAAQEAQRQQTIADTTRQIEIDLLRAQGMELEAVAKEREDELAALAALKPELAAQKQAYYDAVDAAKAKAEAEAKLAQIEGERGDLQNRIDQLTLTDAELLAKARGAELTALEALSPELAEMARQLFSLEDTATATAEAAAQAAAEQEKAMQRMADFAAAQAAAIAERTEGNNALLAGLGDTINSLKDLSRSLDDLAASLSFGELSGQDLEVSYELARQAMLSAKGEDIGPAIQAFLDISRQRSATDLDYSRDVALAQATAKGGSAAAQQGIENVIAMGKALRDMQEKQSWGYFDRDKAAALDAERLAASMDAMMSTIDFSMPSLSSEVGSRVAAAMEAANDTGWVSVGEQLEALNARVDVLNRGMAATVRNTGDASYVLDAAAKGQVSLAGGG